MDFIGKKRPLAALFLGVILVAQSFPAVASSVRAIQPASPSPRGTAPAPTFAPDYILLGQLEGASIVQSQRPRSAALVPGFQYAATYYFPSELQSAYGVASLLSGGYGGRGETIAVIDAYGDPTISQDLALFDGDFGLPNASLSVIPVGHYEPSLGIANGWDAETALDVEAAHAMAPYAHINLLVAANSSNALFEAVKMVVEEHLGTVVTMSWGLGENSFGQSGFSAFGSLNYAYLEYYLQLGAAEGISFFSSSGDYGAFDGTPAVTASYPATSPFVTGVGGTTLFLTPSNGTSYSSAATYEGEEAWSISPQYVGSQGVSSGGGYSTFFSQPYYQRGAVSSGVRSTPDVAADSNPYTGMVIVLEGANVVIGGTSLASPLWAGMAADLDQYVGKSLGLLNPYLYAIYGNPAEYDRDFHQVSYGFDGAYQAGGGYNLLTGIGSPDLPQLAQDIRSLAQGLSVTVTTAPGPSPSAPAQYPYGDTLSISATVATPEGAGVTSGTVTASVESPGGLIATVPLSFTGVAWTGSYGVSPGDPPGSWALTVYASSGSSSGYGLAEVDVGDSLGVLSPVPYPYGAAATPGVPFVIAVSAQSPGGVMLDNASLTARLVYDGETTLSVPLVQSEPGIYVATTSIPSYDQQGSYELDVSGPGVGSVFTYVYVGEEVTGVMLAPNDEAIPSVSPGEQVTFLAHAQTADGEGNFTSSVAASIYSLSGELVASVPLQPAPNTVQFGVFNFFGYQQANFTIPGTLAPGFYRLEFLSSYSANATAGAVMGNYTTGFYVSEASLSYTASVSSTVYEGQVANVVANITDSAGAQVTSGVFLATFIPSGYAYEAYVSDFYGYTSVPMFYDQSAGGWVAQYQIPSVLSPPNAFIGNLVSLSSGPWTVFVTGESEGASNLVPSNSFMNVLPYTYYSLPLLNRSNIQSAPLVSANGTGYLLADIGAQSLEIQGLNITLSGVSIGSLTLVGSNVRLVGSQIGTLTLTNSTVALAGGTTVNRGPGATSIQGSTVATLTYLVYGLAAVAVAALAVALLALRGRRRPAPPAPGMEGRQPPQSPFDDRGPSNVGRADPRLPSRRETLRLSASKKLQFF